MQLVGRQGGREQIHLEILSAEYATPTAAFGVSESIDCDNQKKNQGPIAHHSGRVMAL
ncbi:hypothetical protein CBM2588_A40072 [Cupriavidus taiwanensis]|nr:hypothetical protein CBM2588_A40072 [Cupriavidus taiwanensis]